MLEMLTKNRHLFTSIIILQVNVCIRKGHIVIVEKLQERNLDTGMHNRAITVLQ